MAIGPEQHRTINGQALAFLKAGPADKTIVFIHGNSSCKEAFLGQFQVAMDAGYGVLAVDLPGHGASANASNPSSDYTIPAYARCLRKLCDELAITSPVLCGWSLGGHIAIEMAGESADYSGLLICGTPPVGPGMQYVETAFLPAEVGDVTGAETPTQDRMMAYIKAVYGSLDPIPERLMAAGFRADGKSRSAMVGHWASGQSGHSQREVILSWNKPLSFLHGALDPFVSGDYIRDLLGQRTTSDVELQRLEGVGHAPFLEAPSAFDAAMLGLCEHSFA